MFHVCVQRFDMMKNLNFFKPNQTLVKSTVHHRKYDENIRDVCFGVLKFNRYRSSFGLFDNYYLIID